MVSQMFISNLARKCFESSRNCSIKANVKGFKKIDGLNYLKKFIVDKIKTSGPMTVAEYMKTCVSAPQVGYYGQFSPSQKVFGSQGDFITSPELTQLFGEIVGVWVYNELANTGHSGPWNLVELGPGRGQLIKDVLSAFSKFGEKNITVHLVETSDALIEEQEKTLCSSNSTNINGCFPHVKQNATTDGFKIFWYKCVDDIPEGFSVFIANEFLDALPVHQFKKAGDKWNEIYINLQTNDELCFMTSKGENLHTTGLIPDYIRNDFSRLTWECSPESGTIVNQVVNRITNFGGFSLFVDYGHDGTRNSLSFRAYQKHDQVHPLDDPGAADLTADVDFGYLTSLVKEQALVFGPVPQRHFLKQLGIEHRLRRLVRGCHDNVQQKNAIEAYNMLMEDMGMKFKAWALFPNTLRCILDHRGGPEGFKKI